MSSLGSNVSLTQTPHLLIFILALSSCHNEISRPEQFHQLDGQHFKNSATQNIVNDLLSSETIYQTASLFYDSVSRGGVGKAKRGTFDQRVFETHRVIVR